MRQPRQARRVHARIGAGPEAPARARDAVAPLRPRLGDDCFGRLELIVSELVTNAVRHSGAGDGAPIGVDVHCEGEDAVRVVVSDPGRGFGADQRRGPGAEGGWGLYLVAELADDWRVETGDSTRVVAELCR